MEKTFAVFILFAVIQASLSTKLGHYKVDTKKISVSGLSSGAYFSVQFHVAFSSTIMGVGVMAGGPYFCAQDKVDIALSSCTVQPSGISVPKLVNITHATALTHTIDDPINMRDDRVFLFSGTLDTVIVPGVVKKLAEYYSQFVQNGIATEYTIPAAHSMVTESYGSPCNYYGSPYINNCGYSAAYHSLDHIYGDIKIANSSVGKAENLLEFDQSEFFLNLPAAVCMDRSAFVYVPTDCQDSHTECRLHIAFHGCKQGRKFLSDTFALHAGYNGLAEANNIIILYPQATIGATVPYNPQGCWDWWGYTAPSYASKLGPQMAGVKLMLNRITDL